MGRNYVRALRSRSFADGSQRLADWTKAPLVDYSRANIMTIGGDERQVHR
jgi:hypothetical protein